MTLVEKTAGINRLAGRPRRKVMTIQKLIVLFLFTVSATISLAQTVDTEFDPRIHFPYLKSFSWKKGTPATRPEVDKMIVAEVEKQLISKGLKKTDTKPDVFVAYYGSTKEAVKTDQGGYSVGEWGDAKKKHEAVKVGTLVVDLIGSAKNALVWRGTAEDTVSDDLAKMQTTISRVVGEMFKDYPPGKK
jgi:hypothetical protein